MCPTYIEIHNSGGENLDNDPERQGCTEKLSRRASARLYETHTTEESWLLCAALWGCLPSFPSIARDFPFSCSNMEDLNSTTSKGISNRDLALTPMLQKFRGFEVWGKPGNRGGVGLLGGWGHAGQGGGGAKPRGRAEEVVALLKALALGGGRQGHRVMKLEEVNDLLLAHGVLHSFPRPRGGAAHHVALHYHVLQAGIAVRV